MTYGAVREEMYMVSKNANKFPENAAKFIRMSQKKNTEAQVNV